MRALSIVCGIAVLINALHLTHAIHHFFTIASREGTPVAFLWLGTGFAVLIGILSFIGGVLLLRRAA